MGGALIDPTLALNMELATNGSFLDSVSESSSLVTFTRASAGTYFNSSGVLSSAAVDAARFDYNPATLAPRGLLIEGQRVNKIVRSQEFDNASWTKTAATVVANAVAAPDGTTTADKLTADVGVATHRAFQSPSVAAGTGSLSVFAKAAGWDWIYLRLTDFNGGAAADRYAWFNLATGALGTVNVTLRAAITSVGDDFYRCSISHDDLFATGSTVIGLVNADNVTSVNGDGTSGVYLWGAQFEAGAFPTSYTPTVAIAVTRAADIATMTGTSFSDWYDAATGTFVVEFDVLGASGTRPIISADDNTANEKIELYGSGTNPMVTITDGGGSQANLDVGTIAANTDYTIGLSYAVNDVAACLDGGAVGTDTSATMPTPDRLRLGLDQAGNYLGGHLKSVKFYGEAKADAALQTLTA
jgi:hypothetical protein